MYLNASTDKIEIALAGNVTTNQLNWNVSWQDITSAGMTLPQSGGAGNTNNTTSVDMVSAPAASTMRQVTHINVYNADTVNATVIIRKDVSATDYLLVRVTLATQETLQWSRESGWEIAFKGGTGGSGITTIGVINSQTKAADGAVISGSSLVMQTADGSFPGLVSTAAQTFAGLKTFSGNIISGTVTGSTSASGTLTLVSTSDATKGKILFGSSVYDEVNNRLGIKTANPNAAIEVNVESNEQTLICISYNSGTATPAVTSRRGRGSIASPSAVQLGDALGGIFANGYNGTNFSTTNTAAVIVNAAETFSTTAQGSYIIFANTLIGTNSRTEKLRVDNDGNILIGTTTNSGYKLDVNGTTRTQGDFTISDAKNIILDTTTGTKIATATNQKLGFWNAAPIVQPTTAVAAATRVGGGGTTLTDSDTFDGYTLAQVVKALRNTGILA